MSMEGGAVGIESDFVSLSFSDVIMVLVVDLLWVFMPILPIKRGIDSIS
jgi:hypothetical protein